MFLNILQFLSNSYAQAAKRQPTQQIDNKNGVLNLSKSAILPIYKELLYLHF